MGLFDSVFATNVNTSLLSPAEAVVAIALTAVISDGYFADNESETLWPTLSRMQLFKSYPHDVVSRMVDKLCGVLRRQGMDHLLQMAKQSLPHELCPTVFAIAVDLVLADGTVADGEVSFIESLQRLLEIPQDLAQQIVGVMLIKNKG